MAIFTEGQYRVHAEVDEAGQLVIRVLSSNGAPVIDLDSPNAALQASSDVAEVFTRRLMVRGAGASKAAPVAVCGEEGVVVTLSRTICYKKQFVLRSTTSLTPGQLSRLCSGVVADVGTAEMVEVSQVDTVRRDDPLNKKLEPCMCDVTGDEENLSVSVHAP